jgi:uncharacterized protein (TIGR03435 family)
MRHTKGLLLFAAVAAMATAQTTAFEAASIKLNTAMGGVSSMHITAGHAAIENCSLKKLMLNAYGIPDDREYMIDGPDFLTGEHFDIEARFPADASRAQIQQMLQSLLADRFGMKLHKETRQLPEYALTIAKGGPKIHAVEAGESKTSGRIGHFEATKITMPKLSDLIARMAGIPVIDATGLAGVFDFTLDWSPAADLRVSSSDGAAAADTQGASIFTALQEQLGLRLESRKGPMEVLVVDHMEKMPTEN